MSKVWCPLNNKLKEINKCERCKASPLCPEVKRNATPIEKGKPVWIKGSRVKKYLWTSFCKCLKTKLDVWVGYDKEDLPLIQCKDGSLGPCKYAGRIVHRSPEKISVPCFYPKVMNEKGWNVGIK